MAELGKLRFPDGTIPDGYAIPFYFYDEFMKHNDFYTRIQTMLDDEEFQTSFDTQEAKLKKLRKDIEDAETPQWIIEAIETMNEGFSEGTNRRYRSSTNNETCPGFSGAGLYDSKSQKPSEDEDDLAKSLKEVYAACGTSAPLSNVNSIASTTWRPPWESWCTPATRMNWLMAWPSASTPCMATPATTTSTVRSARTWSPIPTFSRSLRSSP